MEKKTIKKKVTLSDIAKELNLSANAVSKALHGKSDISIKTQELVRETAERMGYIKNNMASLIRSGKSNIVGVVVSSLTSPYYILGASNVLTMLQNNKFTTLLKVTEDRSLDDKMVYELIENRVCAIITFVETERDAIQLCKKQSLPIIVVGTETDDEEISNVYADEVITGEIAANEFFAMNKKRPCYVNTKTFNNSIRKNAFIEILKEHNIEVDQYSLDFENSFEVKEEFAKLIKANRNDFIFCFNDEIASIVLGILEFHKIKFCKVLGVDGTPNSLSISRKFDSIGFDFGVICGYIKEILLKTVENEEIMTIKYKYKPHLIKAKMD